MRGSCVLLALLVASCSGAPPELAAGGGGDPLVAEPTPSARVSPSPSTDAPLRDQATGGTVRMLFAGDVMLGRGVAPIVAADPHGVFQDVRGILSNADLAAVNLESPLTTRAHVAGPYPLEAHPSGARLLANAGFDIAAVANNHAGDAGPEGVLDTLEALRAAGLASVGAGADASEAFAPLLVRREGLTIAVVAVDATGGGTPAGTGPGVAWWDPLRVRLAVREARARADVVVASVHSGTEYEQADARTRGIVRRLAGWGVDVVWGHHPHVVHGVRTIDPDGDGRRTVVATSLGNFLFDQPFPGTRTGAVLEVLAGREGPIAYRVGVVQHRDRRVHPRRWLRPDGQRAAALDEEWWTLVAPVRLAERWRAGGGSTPSLPGSVVIDASLGDLDGDGRAEAIVAFRRPFRPAPLNEAAPERRWVDSEGRSAHVGVYRARDLRPLWVAGGLVRPVGALLACGAELAVGYTTLDEPAIVATGAWSWKGFGFSVARTLPGPGVPGCADVDRDGRFDPVIVGRGR